MHGSVGNGKEEGGRGQSGVEEEGERRRSVKDFSVY